MYHLKGLVALLARLLIQVQVTEAVVGFRDWWVRRPTPDHPDLDLTLPDFVFWAVSAEVSCFAALETCLLFVTLLAFFLRKAVLAPSLGVLVLVLLHLASHDGVSISVFVVALLLHIGRRGLERLFLFISFPQPVVNSRG